MSTAEADHGRARIYMHTGYQPGFGGVTYPALGSTVASEVGDPELALPAYVVTGSPLVKYDVLRDPGYRGPRYQPLVLPSVNDGLENATPQGSLPEFERRVSVLDQLERNFANRTQTARKPQPHDNTKQASMPHCVSCARTGLKSSISTASLRLLARLMDRVTLGEAAYSLADSLKRVSRASRSIFRTGTLMRERSRTSLRT